MNYIGNPKCSVGCGTWKAPTVKNPKYKGIWKRPTIKNPLYKGVWAAKKIPNPDYYEDLHPHNFEPIEAIGFEIWTMSEGITFDNIYLGFDEKKAMEFAQETFSPKFKVEKAFADKEAQEAAPKPDVGAGLLSVVRTWFDDFIFIWKTESLVAAVVKNPGALGGLAFVSVSPVLFLWLLFFVYNKTIGRLPKKQADNIDDLADLFKDFPVKKYEKKIREEIEQERTQKIAELKGESSKVDEADEEKKESDKKEADEKEADEEVDDEDENEDEKEDEKEEDE